MPGNDNDISAKVAKIAIGKSQWARTSSVHMLVRTIPKLQELGF